MAASAKIIPIRKFAHQYKSNKRDPELDEIIKLIEQSGMSKQGISNRCGVSVSCLSAWLSGKTNRPQNITVNFVARACGFERGEWKRIK